MMIYDEEKREISVTEENEYIYNVTELYTNIYKFVKLSPNDIAENYVCIVSDDIDTWLEEKHKEYNDEFGDDLLG